MGCLKLHNFHSDDKIFSDYTPKLEVVRDILHVEKMEVEKLGNIAHYADYYPYGMLMPGRHGEADNSSYRYGFQGQEKDDEIKGKGNSINYKYRMHDPRLGRFFAVDPLSPIYPHNSPYAFSENVVIHAVELEGLEKRLITDIPDGSGRLLTVDGQLDNRTLQIPSNAQNIIRFSDDFMKGVATGNTIFVVKGSIRSFESDGIEYTAMFYKGNEKFAGYFDANGNEIKTSLRASVIKIDQNNTDNIGFITGSSDHEKETAPIMASLKDGAVMILNDLMFIGSIDNAVAITLSDEYSTTDKFLSWLPIIINVKGKKTPGRIAPSKMTKGTQIDISKFDSKKGQKSFHSKSGWYIEKDRLGDNSHGGSAYKLYNKKGDRQHTLDKDGKILRD